MKAILEFDLPEDNYNHRLAVVAQDVQVQIVDLLHDLRSLVKHDCGPFAGKDAVTVAEEVMSRLFEMEVRE